MAKKSVWQTRWMPRQGQSNDRPGLQESISGMSATVIALTSFVLVASSIGAFLFAIFLPQISHNSLMRRRRDVALGLRAGSGQSRGGRETADDRPTRRSIEETLRNIEQKSRAQHRGRTSLPSRLRRAGLTWTPTTYRGTSAGLALVIAGGLWIGLGLAPLPSVGLGLAAGLWLPHAFVKFRINRQQRAFTTAFPDALDIIVRGVRAGIPLTDCMRIVGTESQQPVRAEFRTTVEDLVMGLAVEEAVQRMSDRVGLEEARFFAIVIAIQTKTGGNLSEALGNLSIVLRDRAKMRRKIRSMSSESKASAGIIGSLPPIVCFLVFMTSPGYVGLLFTTVAGNLLLAGSGLWMLCGILVMRNMINFDF